MQPNDEQLKAEEEAKFIKKAIRKIRKTPDVLFSSDPKVKSHEEKLTDLFVSLLAEREVKARQEGGEKVAKAVEEAECNNVYHTEDAKKYRADGYCNFCYAAKTAARQALKIYKREDMKKLTAAEKGKLASLKAAFAEAHQHDCEHIGKEVIYDEKEEVWKDEFGGEAEPPFPCDGCGGQFCTECFGRNKCKECEENEE